jgi:hypothetical protein
MNKIQADNPNVTQLISALRQLSPVEQREVLARLWPEQQPSEWRFLQFQNPTVKSFSDTQDPYLDDLKRLLREGVLARLDHPEDGNYELYGEARTYYATLIPEEEFAGLLSSWPPDQPPVKVDLEDDETSG